VNRVDRTACAGIVRRIFGLRSNATLYFISPRRHMQNRIAVVASVNQQSGFDLRKHSCPTDVEI
jgi:hypothetical protein